MPQWQKDALDRRLAILSAVSSSSPLTAKQISDALRAYAKRMFGAADMDIDAYLASRNLPL